MIRFPACANIDEDLLVKLGKIKEDDRHAAWYGGRKIVKEFKEQILVQGRNIQGERCAWCTLPFGAVGRRRIDRDHIAPASLHKKWTFHPKNLVLSCEFCNGLEVKKDIDTVNILHDDYDQCVFHIVHPYLDIVSDHIQFDNDEDELPVLIIGKTDKGKWTISNIKLDSSGLTTERAKEAYYAKRPRRAAPTNNDDKLILAALQAIG